MRVVFHRRLFKFIDDAGRILMVIGVEVLMQLTYVLLDLRDPRI